MHARLGTLVRAALAILASLGALAPLAPIVASAAPATVMPPPREVTDLSQGWRFRFGGDDAGIIGERYDDSAWEQVSAPHTWNRVGAYAASREYPGRDDAQGVGWYRLTFAAPKAAGGRRSYLEFDGVSAVARVWLNGRAVGEHRGGFSRFRLDVTELLRPGRNLLVVSADNSKPTPGSATADVLPIAGDFFVYGGIYRGVRLISVADAQIDMLDHGGPGIYAATRLVSGGNAQLSVRTRIRNVAGRLRRMVLTTSLVSADGVVAATASSPAEIAAGGIDVVDQAMSVPHAHLWNGTADPYLHRLVAELREDDRVIDRVEQPFGIRTMRIDADSGFSLNGRSLQLHGVARHQDLMGRGWAMTAADQAADMATIKDMGANAIRLAHYQHAQDWVGDADAAGMVTWAEIPFVTAANLEGRDPTPALVANAREQLTELIRQNYNHPSIAMWSIGNEVNAGELFLPGRKPQHSLSLLRELNALAKQEDATRPTTFADCCEDAEAFRVTGPPLAGTADLIGYNRYFGWYYGKPADLGPALDMLHAKHPGLPIGVSEYGAGGAVSQHTDNPLGGPVAIVGRPHPEEYESWYHEQSWKTLSTRRYLYGTWLWTMFDFASDMRSEGDSVDLNDKGLVTFDRRIRKDAYYFYQAQWSDRPMLHLTGRRYVDRAYPVVDVRAYSNAETASLTVNGVRVGTAACPDHICVWPDVRLAAGSNHVEARASAKGVALADALDWTAPDAADGLHIESGELNGGTIAGVRYGSDNFFVGGRATLLNELTLRPSGGATPAKTVGGKDDPQLHHAFREGAFRYELPVPAGTWTVTLHMTEPDPVKAAIRSFDVIANGRQLLAEFSPARAAGGPLIAVERAFNVEAVNGAIVLEFVPRDGEAIVSAIDITKINITKRGEVK